LGTTGRLGQRKDVKRQIKTAAIITSIPNTATEDAPPLICASLKAGIVKAAETIAPILQATKFQDEWLCSRVTLGNGGGLIALDAVNSLFGLKSKADG